MIVSSGRAQAGAAGALGPDRSIRGRAELVSALLGIQGWAVDLDRPGDELEVELWVGDRKLGSCSTGLMRPDLTEQLGPDALVGFAFDDAVLAEFKTVSAAEIDTVEVRVAGMLLDIATPAHMIAPASSRQGGAEIDLLARLSHLRSEANRARERALRPIGENNVGYIEAAAVDEGGLVWLIGWMVMDALVDRPVVILDSSKIPAGFAYTLMHRSDLPSGAAGFIGVLQTDWRPTKSAKPFFFIDEDGQQFLEGLNPFNVISKQTLLNHCRDLWQFADVGYSAALRRLMQQARSWSPLPEDLVAERAAVEEVLVLPGFGCFVSGWVVSPAKEVEHVALKIGSTVLVAEPTAMSTKPRPDLGNIYPGVDRMLEHAGFSAALVGLVDPAAMSDAILKIIYRDGTSSNHAIPAGQVRRLGQTVNINRVLDFFPSIASESFFGDFARAVRAEEQTRIREVQPFQITPCDTAIVCTVPEERSDIFLMFENLRTGLRAINPSVGAVIIAGQDENRSLVVRLFKEYCRFGGRYGGRPLSLVFVPDRALAAYSIPTIAEIVDLKRFIFVAKTATLGAAGLQAVDRFDGSLTFLGVEDPVRDFAPSEMSFECFGWSVAEFDSFLAGADVLLGGLHLRPPSLSLLARAAKVEKAALRIRTPVQTAIVEAINRATESA